MAGDPGRIGTALAWVFAYVLYGIIMIIVWVMVFMSWVKKLIKGKDYENKSSI